MGISSLQVCMDSSDWLQGPISEENTGLMDSPPTNGGDCEDILACSRPLVERRLRPPHEQSLKCPRCDSTHTKFCYYNNYSLTQPRYFCKTCRRYWTKGGTLRNIPVGGGCRKNKKVSSTPKKQPSPSTSATNGPGPNNNDNNRSSSLSIRAGPGDLQLAFPEQLQFSSVHGPGLFNPGYLFENMGPVEYNNDKYDHAAAFMGSMSHSNNNDHLGMMQNEYHGGVVNQYPLFGLSSNYNEHIGIIDNPGGSGSGNHILESCQRLMLPYDDNNHHHHHRHHLDIQNNNNNNNNIHQCHQVDVKPNAKILSLEWHDCNSDAGMVKDSFGYNLGGLGSWAGLMNGYGTSATNPLV